MLVFPTCPMFLLVTSGPQTSWQQIHVPLTERLPLGFCTPSSESQIDLQFYSIFRVCCEAYSVLLLHQEVDGHLAGLSRSLSREEHLVLFSVSACT